jgi:hypothetical protein
MNRVMVVLLAAGVSMFWQRSHMRLSDHCEKVSCAKLAHLAPGSPATLHVTAYNAKPEGLAAA